MIIESIKMALVSIRSAKLRSFLTILGIIIGIASVVTIDSLGQGLKKQVASQIDSLGANVITVISGQVATTNSQGQRGFNPAAQFGSSTLTETDLAEITNLPNIKHAAPMMLISGLIMKGSATSAGALLVATTPELRHFTYQKMASGRFLDASDHNQKVAVLGSKVKADLFGKSNAIGESVSIRGASFTVIGVVAADTNSDTPFGGGFEQLAYLPLETARELTGGNLQILRILAAANSAESLDQAVTDIKNALLGNHGGQEDFSVLTQEDLVGTVGTILSALTTAIKAIAAIALLVAGIGIMNIMLVSVTERTREIGIRKAIGANSKVVLLQFLIEAMTLSLLGGILGILLSIGVGRIAKRVVNLDPVITPQIVITACIVAVGVGLIFGMMPAVKAARKRPIEALRYE